jgi:hypothetical protein
MTAQFLFVDNNSYLRLASHVHPNFWGGHPQYELRFVAFAERELGNTRLRNKFPWTNRDPHPGLRKKWEHKVTKVDLKAIALAEPTVEEYAEAAIEAAIPHRRKFDGHGEAVPYLSPTDLRLLTCAVHFSFGLLTDERALTIAAKDNELAVVSSLQLLRYLELRKHVDAKKVDGIVQYWHTDHDLPHSDWVKDFRRIFKRSPPKLSL